MNLGRAESQPAAEWSDCAAHASGQQGVVCSSVFSGWEKSPGGKIYIYRKRGEDE